MPGQENGASQGQVGLRLTSTIPITTIYIRGMEATLGITFARRERPRDIKKRSTMSVLRRRETATLLNLRSRLLSENKEEIERRRQTTREKSNTVPDEMARVVTTGDDLAVNSQRQCLGTQFGPPFTLTLPIRRRHEFCKHDLTDGQTRK
jgi:hypothetical protein